VFNGVLHIGHLARPETAVLGGPAVVDQLNRDRVVEELAGATLLERHHQPARLELPQVVHHGDPPDVELLCQLADQHPGRGAQQIEDPAPGRVTQGVEHLGHIVEGGGGRGAGGRHMLKYINIFWRPRKTWCRRPYADENDSSVRQPPSQSTTTAGTALLTVRDAAGTVVYTNALVPSRNEPTAVGTAGTWTIVVTMTSYTGSLNFRAQKL